MGRPRAFKETELLEAVMAEFWRHGFSATTYRSLEAMSGVGIRSLVNTFGEKDELFASALACYRERVTANLDTMFNPPSVDGIIRVFERVSSATDDDDPRQAGCLMVNTTFEIDSPPEIISGEIALYRELWSATFHQALEADDIPDTARRAEFLVGALWGALSLIRMAGNTTAAQPMTSVVIETVRGWHEPATHPIS